MTVFDQIAKEAAAKAIRDDRTPYETAEQYSLAKATAALSAAEASMRKRQLVRDGVAEPPYEPSHDFWKVWQTNSKSTGLEFPVTIIRKETP